MGIGKAKAINATGEPQLTQEQHARAVAIDVAHRLRRAATEAGDPIDLARSFLGWTSADPLRLRALELGVGRVTTRSTGATVLEHAKAYASFLDGDLG